MNKIYALVHQYDYEDSETGYDVTKNEKVSFYESKEDAEKHLRNLKRGLVFHRDYRNWLIKRKGQWNQHIFKLFRLYLPYEQKDVQGPVRPEVFNQIEDQEVNKPPTVSSCSPLFGTFERERSLRCWHPEATEQDDIPVDFIRFNDEDDGIRNEIVYIEEIPLFKGL